MAIFIKSASIFVVTEWIREEFKSLELGDKRLTDRFVSVMESFNLRPDGCINRIFRDEGAARKASYRFFENPRVSTKKILDCHTKMTRERMKEHRVVLSLHDSSFLATTPSLQLRDSAILVAR